MYDGVAARASEVNSESLFALSRYKLPVPSPYKEVVAAKETTVRLGQTSSSYNVCLLDHNQASQMTEGVDTKRIVGIIDHHAIQDGAVVTDKPVWIDIRPWGSACTIIAHCFIRESRHPTREVAGMLLCGILSGTQRSVD